MTYPADLGETYVTPNTTDKLNNPSHTARHQAEATEIQALKEKVGIDSSADSDSVDYKLTLKEVTANKDTTTTLGSSDTKYPSQKAVKTYIDQAIADAKLAMYPVGAIYVSVSSTNPGTFIGGTWSAFGAGRTMVGLDSGDADFDTVEETGGAKTHTLTEPELPYISGSWVMHGQESGTMFYIKSGYATGTYFSGQYKTLAPTGGAYSYTNPGFAFGDGVAHNNLQPYVVTYMFKRTA